MKANELRLNNLVKISSRSSECVYKVEGLDLDTIDAYCVDRCDPFKNVYHEPLEGVLAIPLTEEWLLKFGFNDNHSYFNLTDYPSFKITWAIRNASTNKRSSFYLDDNFTEDFQVNLNYVHSLQNLYFALTGEELEIKL